MMNTDFEKYGVTTLAELALKPEVAPTYRVQNLIRTGTPRPTLLCGRPQAGKSDLARQLCTAVASGQPFLGRETSPCAVYWWGSEDSPEESARLFRIAGHKIGEHHTIYVRDHDPKDPNRLAILHDFLASHQDIGLVVVETLDSLLRISDVNKNSEAREAFDRLHNFVMHDLFQRVAVVALAQLKKRASDLIASTILGATEINARSDTQIFLKRERDGDSRRIISAHVREGREIPPTYVEWDAETRSSRLGVTVSAEHAASKRETEESVEERLIQFLMSRPGSTEPEIMAAVTGKTDVKKKLLRSKVKAGSIIRSGSGISGNPYKHSLCELQMETGLAA